MKEVELSARSANSAGTQNSPREASTAPEHPPINYSATQAYTLLLKAKQDELPESMARTLNKLSSTLNAPPKETAQPQAGQPFGKLSVALLQRDDKLKEQMAQFLSSSRHFVRQRDAAAEFSAINDKLPAALQENTAAGQNLAQFICEGLAALTNAQNMGAGLERDLAVRGIFVPQQPLNLRTKAAASDALSASIAYIKSNQPAVLATLPAETSAATVNTAQIEQQISDLAPDQTYLDIFKQHKVTEEADDESAQMAERIRALISKAADTAKKGNLIGTQSDPAAPHPPAAQPQATERVFMPEQAATQPAPAPDAQASKLSLAELSARASRLQQQFREERQRLAAEGKLPNPAIPPENTAASATEILKHTLSPQTPAEHIREAELKLARRAQLPSSAPNDAPEPPANSAAAPTHVRSAQSADEHPTLHAAALQTSELLSPDDVARIKAQLRSQAELEAEITQSKAQLLKTQQEILKLQSDVARMQEETLRTAKETAAAQLKAQKLQLVAQQELTARTQELLSAQRQATPSQSAAEPPRTATALAHTALTLEQPIPANADSHALSAELDAALADDATPDAAAAKTTAPPAADGHLASAAAANEASNLKSTYDAIEAMLLSDTAVDSESNAAHVNALADDVAEFTKNELSSEVLSKLSTLYTGATDYAAAAGTELSAAQTDAATTHNSEEISPVAEKTKAQELAPHQTPAIPTSQPNAATSAEESALPPTENTRLSALYQNSAAIATSEETSPVAAATPSEESLVKTGSEQLKEETTAKEVSAPQTASPQAPAKPQPLQDSSAPENADIVQAQTAADSTLKTDLAKAGATDEKEPALPVHSSASATAKLTSLYAPPASQEAMPAEKNESTPRAELKSTAPAPAAAETAAEAETKDKNQAAAAPQAAGAKAADDVADPDSSTTTAPATKSDSAALPEEDLPAAPKEPAADLMPSEESQAKAPTAPLPPNTETADLRLKPDELPPATTAAAQPELKPQGAEPLPPRTLATNSLSDTLQESLAANVQLRRLYQPTVQKLTPDDAAAQSALQSSQGVAAEESAALLSGSTLSAAGPANTAESTNVATTAAQDTAQHVLNTVLTTVPGDDFKDENDPAANAAPLPHQTLSAPAAAAITAGGSQPLPELTQVEPKLTKEGGFFKRLAALFTGKSSQVSPAPLPESAPSLTASRGDPLQRMFADLNALLQRGDVPADVKAQANDFISKLQHPVADLTAVNNWLSFVTGPLSPSSPQALALHQWAFLLLCIRFSQIGRNVTQFVSKYQDEMPELTRRIKGALKDGAGSHKSAGSISALIDDTFSQVQRLQQLSDPHGGLAQFLGGYVPLPPNYDGGSEGGFNLKKETDRDGKDVWHLNFFFDLKELGPIQVKAEAKLPELYLHIVTDNLQALKQVQQLMPQLKAKLQDLGITTREGTARLGHVFMPTASFKPTAADKQRDEMSALSLDV